MSKVIQLTNGDLAVELTPEHLEKAGLKVGDHVLWDPRKMGFSKFNGSTFSFPLGDSDIQVSCPPVAAPWENDSNLVQITLRLRGNTINNIIPREAFDIFVRGLADLNKELSFISEIVSVPA